MKKIWAFFSSIWLTVALAALICIVSAWGSIVSMKNPELYRQLDMAVLMPWLLGSGVESRLVLWIYILIGLMALFTINTFVCTTDKVYSILKAKRPWQSFFPHIVHIGFLIALLGHLAGSVGGFRSYNNVLFRDRPVPVPHAQDLSVRLDGVKAQYSQQGELKELKTTVTILDGDKEIKKGDIEINGPLIYKGIAFYYLDQGEDLAGFELEVDGKPVKAGLYEGFSVSADKTYSFGELYPDFAMSPEGEAYSRSGSYANPHIEVISQSGQKAMLDISGRGAPASIDGITVKHRDYIMSPYVVLSINKDPGISLIIAGSIVLVTGMVLLLFFRGSRAELLRQKT